MIHAGKLRHKFEIQKPVSTRTASGENQITWYHYAVRHGEYIVESVTENLELKQITAQRSGTVKMRYCKGLDETYRLKYGTRYLSIISVDNVGELNREMVLKVVEYAA